MLTPADLRRLPNALLRARFTAHLLDEPGPNREEFEEIFRTAVEELMAAGFGLAEIATGTFMEESELRRRVLSAVEASPTADGTTPRAYCVPVDAARPMPTLSAVPSSNSDPCAATDDDAYAAAVRQWQDSDTALRRRLAEIDDTVPLGEDLRRELLQLDRDEDDGWLRVVEIGRRLGARLPLRNRPQLPF